jgi:hypothetical protein
MVDQVIQNTFAETYRDDYSDSAGFHKILFNNGRAIQSRELNQLQTIIQTENSRLFSNVFTEGAIVSGAGFTGSENAFVKLNETTNALPVATDTLLNTEFTGAISGVKAIVTEIVTAVGADPGTLYVQYTSGSGSNIYFTPGENINNGSTTLTIQTTDTTVNPARGVGAFLTNNEGVFHADGRLIFAPAQTIVTSKYSVNNSVQQDFGFLLSQDIVTSNDDTSLFDNSGPTLNTSSPGADRHRMLLTLSLRDELDSDAHYIQCGVIAGSDIIDANKSINEKNYNTSTQILARRTAEESGDYIVDDFVINFADDSDTANLDISVQPGVAYVDGYRAATTYPADRTVAKPRSITTINNEVVPITLGNYVRVQGAAAKGQPSVANMAVQNLRSAVTHGGSTIGTARVRAIEEDGTSGVYRLHLFQITMNSGQNFRSVRSIGTSTSAYMDIALENTQCVLHDPKVNTLLYPLPKVRPSNITDISLAVQRRFTGTSNGSGVLSLSLSASGETFANTNDWVISATAGAVDESTSISGSGTTSATISTLANSTAHEIVGYVNQANGSSRSKTLNLNHTETIATTDWVTAGGVTYAELTYPDVYKFTSVTRDTVSGTSVEARFTLDNGQRDNYYGLGRLVLKSGQSTPNYPVVVKYDYFTHGTSGSFFSVNSYTGVVDYEDIPVHINAFNEPIALRNVLDFRPVVNSSGTFGSGAVINEIPQSADTVQADVSYYNSRYDKVVIDTNGEIQIVTGDESLTPNLPAHPDNTLELFRILLNGYTLNYKDLSSKTIEHKHFTMQDIGTLERRVDSLEESTSLSLLELDTANLAVLDSDGNMRSKSGFFVDNFADHSFAGVEEADYQAAIDPQDKLMRPMGRTDGINLMYDSDNALNSGVIKKGDNIYLDYTHRLLVNQSSASRTENVIPFWVIRFDGHVILSPSSDNWIEQEYMPDAVTNVTKLNTSANNLWNAHNWNWGGTALEDLQVGSSTNKITLSSSSGSLGVGPRTFRNRTRRQQVQGNEGWTITDTTNFTATETLFTDTTVGQFKITGENTVNTVTNDRLIQAVSIPFMRSRKIFFQGKGFRPNTQVFAFFDGIDVSDWVRSETFVRTSDAAETVGNVQNAALGHPEGSSTLVASALGDIEGSFFIPSTSNFKFKTGTRTFTLIDVTNPDNNEHATSFGQQNFSSKGSLQTRQQDVLSTRTLEVDSRTENVRTTSQRTVVSSDTRTRFQPDGNGRIDPLAQSFHIAQQNGVFATKVDVFFESKDPNGLPMWGQLRAMENGYPAEQIMGGSTIFKYPSEITTSTDASVATTFEFVEPVFLAPGKEYCWVMLSTVPTFKVWISKVGDFELGTTDRKITQQSFLGSLFKSQNNSTWTASQWEDLKFKLHVADFGASGTALISNTPIPQRLLPADPLSVDSADATITVSQASHGLLVGGTVNISGSPAFAGITAGNINGARTVTKVDGNAYQFEAGANSTSAEIGGGSALLADQNIRMDQANINIATLLPMGTKISPSINTITGQSIAGTETAYQVNTSYTPFTLGKEIYFDFPQLIANAANETAQISGEKSLNIKLGMSTEDSFVSPVIDMQRASVLATNNIIDRQAAGAAAGFNVPMNYVAETDPKGGSSAAKHITIPVTLAEDAVGLKLFISANKPNGASFDVYFRTSSGDAELNDIAFTAVNPLTSLITDNDPNTFREYEYLIGGNTGTLDAFNSFQIKIVMVSENNAKVPVFRDMRTIAMAT